MERLDSSDSLLRVRILGPTEVFLTADVDSLRVNLYDGVMCINKRYASVIERIKEGEIKLKFPFSQAQVDSKSEKKYYVSSGWLINSHNLCELLVKDFRECE